MSVTKVLLQAEALTPNERKELLKLLHDLVAKDEQKPKRSLFELAGLGKEVWQDIDTDAYLNELRDEWDQAT
ncbi:MAG: hypothetical protein OXE52_07930 [Chloroflexi bacterium]|nr:hypothetical protein [Chloroflexota bacterium]